MQCARVGLMMRADLRMHHIGVLVKDIPQAAEEFVSRLGYVIESEIIDEPEQTARVQFLRQPGSTFWLELITPDRPDSKLSRALAKSPGLHHLCYEAEDIERVCAQLRQESMFIVASPTPSEAFEERSIAWLMDRAGLLVEIVETGTGPLSLHSIAKSEG